MKQFILFQTKNRSLEPQFYYSSRQISSLRSSAAALFNHMLYECTNFSGQDDYGLLNYRVKVNRHFSVSVGDLGGLCSVLSKSKCASSAVPSSCCKDTEKMAEVPWIRHKLDHSQDGWNKMWTREALLFVTDCNLHIRSFHRVLARGAPPLFKLMTHAHTDSTSSKVRNQW